MQLRRQVWMAAALGVTALWQDRASACSVLLPQQQSLTCPAPGSEARQLQTSLANIELQLGAVEVRRSQYAPPGRGDCGELGHLRLHFKLAGKHEWPADVGLLLTLKQGDFPYFQPPPTQLPSASGWLLLPRAGDVRFLGPDHPRRPLQVVLEARAVDCSNAVSAPIEVHINEPGRPLDAGLPRPGDATAATATGGAPAAPLTEVRAARRSPSQRGCAFTAQHTLSRGGGVALGTLGLAAVTALALRRRSHVGGGRSRARAARANQCWR